MELWADIYAHTKDERCLELIKRYERPNLYNPLLDDIDVLTNIHANSTVPEIHGAARAYEATGDERYRKVVEKYWEFAVEKRGAFVTGGQTAGEVWTPLQKQSARLNNMNQEHCVVYNMMRLADYLYKWTGDTKYANYWEQNLHNGIYAQGYWEENHNFLHNGENPPKKGHVAYYLPLETGAVKLWGSETEHFWCCHCTLVQANANFHEHIYYKGEKDKNENENGNENENENDIYIAQYLPSELKTDINGQEIKITQMFYPQTGAMPRIHEVDRVIIERPENIMYKFSIEGNSTRFRLRFRIPWWISEKPVIILNGESLPLVQDNGYIIADRVWENDEIIVTLPKKLRSWILPDRPDTAAFIDGPVALCGLTDKQYTLIGNIANPEDFIIPDAERKWTEWLPYYRTVNQPVNFRLVPIKEIGYEKYTTYFQIK
jgi:DUF1680 family protein